METKKLDKKMLQLQGAVEFAKAVQELNQKNTENGGSGGVKKHYVKRKLETQRQHFQLDKDSREKMDSLLDIIEVAFGIRISKSILVRAGIRKIHDHISDIINGGSPDDLLEIVNEEVEFFKSMGKC